MSCAVPERLWAVLWMGLGVWTDPAWTWRALREGGREGEMEGGGEGGREGETEIERGRDYCKRENGYIHVLNKAVVVSMVTHGLAVCGEAHQTWWGWWSCRG